MLDLEHYLDVLSHKSGAFAGSKPLAQWREAGRWPPCYDELWARLLTRHGKQNGTRAMVAVLALGREFGHNALRAAISTAISLGACDVAAVRYLLTETALQKGMPPAMRVRLRTRDGDQNVARPVMRLDSLVGEKGLCRQAHRRNCLRLVTL